jgi:hypothetical protein
MVLVANKNYLEMGKCWEIEMKCVLDLRDSSWLEREGSIVVFEIVR